MCWPFKNKPLVKATGYEDYIHGHDPTKEWMAGKMPSYTIDDLCAHLQERLDIHRDYYDRIRDGTDPQSNIYGDANFHLWAIEGYENAIYYMKGGQPDA